MEHQVPTSVKDPNRIGNTNLAFLGVIFSFLSHEDYLQKYIHDNPDVIPLYEIDNDIRILVLAREYPTNCGPIDAIGIDQEGNIYLIETKLYKNPDKRKVVAQVLDYGASLWKYSVDFSEFTNRVGKQVQENFGVSKS